MLLHDWSERTNPSVPQQHRSPRLRNAPPATLQSRKIETHTHHAAMTMMATDQGLMAVIICVCVCVCLLPPYVVHHLLSRTKMFWLPLSLLKPHSYILYSYY